MTPMNIVFHEMFDYCNDCIVALENQDHFPSNSIKFN